VHAALQGEVSLRRVREALRALKARWRRVQRRLAEERRVHVVVHALDALWSQDATHLGRCARDPGLPEQNVPFGEVLGAPQGPLRAVQGEVVKDVASTELVDVRVGPPATGEDVVAMLEAMRIERGLPLVHATDNGVYACRRVREYLAAHQVVHLRSLPRTPQHNAWVERSNGELKLEAGLGAGVVLRDDDEARDRVEPARRRLNEQRPRTSRGGLTAAQLDASLPHWQSRVSREVFWKEACSTIERLTKDASNERERRMREREAIFCTLEKFGLVTRTRGGTAQPAVKAEVNC
jgi:transposase InsO family protein